MATWRVSKIRYIDNLRVCRHFHYTLGQIYENIFFKIFKNILQLLMQSVPMTTNIVSSNPAHADVYPIQHYVIKFASDKRQVDGFLCVHRFLPPIKLSAMLYLYDNKCYYYLWLIYWKILVKYCSFSFICS
jgi:hypothetical protein